VVTAASLPDLPPVNGETDLYAATSTETTKLTTEGVSPSISPLRDYNICSPDAWGMTGRELGRVSGFDFTVESRRRYQSGPGSSDPDQFLAIDGGAAFLTAFDGTARRLYRADGSVVELIRASDGSLLTVDATHEKVKSEAPCISQRQRQVNLFPGYGALGNLRQTRSALTRQPDFR
jgi:hypothetical protein